MNKSIRRATAALGLIVLLALDALLAHALTVRAFERKSDAEDSAPVEAVDPIDRFRLEREQLRAREQAQLNDIIYSDKTDAQTVERAQAQLLSLLSRSEQELALEGLLQSRGYDGALVSVGERSANVLIRREVVTQRESAVILDLVLRETGLTGGNVKIIPVK